MRICIIGTGYVGLVSGACFAELGHEVACIDTDADKIAVLTSGGMPIHEPGLAEMIARNVALARLSFSLDVASVRHAQAVFICVGTPARADDGHADLSHVYAAAGAMAPALSKSVLVVVKSTVPVGTADAVERIIAQLRPGLDFHVVSNPEFLRAGAAIRDFQHPYRIVVGGDGAACTAVARIYGALDGVPVVRTSRRTAELVKYASNAFLATKIAYINEIADLCERVGADVQDVAHAVGLDERIGRQFLEPGPGFGGSCFPKDALALLKMAEDAETPLRIVESVIAANDRRKRAMARKVAAALGSPLTGKTVALLGLTFKPDTDDMREAPSLALIAGLRDMGAHVRAYDPMVAQRDAHAGAVTCCVSPYEAAAGADVLVVVTHWEQFRTLDLNRLKRLMRSPVILDLRSVFFAEGMARNGFRYHRIGAPSAVAAASAAPPALAPVRRLRAKAAKPAGNGAAWATRRDWAGTTA